MTITNSPVTNKDKAVVETDGYVVQFAKPESDWSQSNEQQFQICKFHSPFLKKKKKKKSSLNNADHLLHWRM